MPDGRRRLLDALRDGPVGGVTLAYAHGGLTAGWVADLRAALQDGSIVRDPETLLYALPETARREGEHVER